MRTVHKLKTTLKPMRSLVKKHRPVAVFFVLLMLFAGSYTLIGALTDHYLARRAQVLRNQPLATATVTETAPEIDGVTDDAKNTAVLHDPGIPSEPTALTDQELPEKRTEYSYTYQNDQGGETERVYTEPVNFEKDGKWEKIHGTLTEDAEYIEDNKPKESLLDRILPGTPENTTKAYKQDDGQVALEFKPLDASNVKPSVAMSPEGALGSVRIRPLDTNTVNPEIRGDNGEKQYIEYKGAWNNVDLIYEQSGTSLKEYIILNSADVPSEMRFAIYGGKLSYGLDEEGKRDGSILVETPQDEIYVIPPLSVLAHEAGILTEPPVRYEIKGATLIVAVDTDWLSELPHEYFPLAIDPTTTYHGLRSHIPGGYWNGQFKTYKSDGWSGTSANSNINVGALNDRGHKVWRSMIRLPLTSVYGKPVAGAGIYMRRVYRSGVSSGFNGNRTYHATWAHCFGFHCVSGAPRATGNIDADGWLDAYALMDWISKNNVGDGWLIFWSANENDLQSWKSFDGDYVFLDVHYYNWNKQAPAPAHVEPANNAVVSARPTLKVNTTADPDGDVVRYAFRVYDKTGKTVAYSGERDIHWWTVPDNILVDGEKYSWNVQIIERTPGGGLVSNNISSAQQHFTYDLRTGKDKTQTFDDVGPLSISLNKGNAYTSAATHSIGAVGGSIGLSLDYNTPDLSQMGLTATYYNKSGSNLLKAITVRDANIDQAWGTGSPYPGIVQADNFAINWEGYFVAPETGSYRFVAGRDGANFKMSLDGQEIFNFNGCCWNDAPSTVTLTKGQAYRVSAWYTADTGVDAVHLNVYLPGSTTRTTVKPEWLRTLSDPQNTNQGGLTAKVYRNTNPTGNTTYQLNSDAALSFVSQVPQVDFNWGSGSLIAVDPGSIYKDHMIITYSGFLTIPTTGHYKIGANGDDGLRIRLGGQQVAAAWSAGGHREIWSQSMHLEAGTVLPIQLEYFEKDGNASVKLLWDGPAGKSVIPGQYLSTKSQVLPNGWAASIDTDGSVPYEFLTSKDGGNVELLDSDGFTHLYTWTGSSYKPPVNEGGLLVKNSDATYTLTDTDGRVYNFNMNGQVTSISSPTDDKNPSALRYEYAASSTSAYTSLPKLSKIIDGIDPSRFGQLYYWQEQDASTICAVAADFDTPKPGDLCAFRTSADDEVTRLQYKGNQLARIELPGNIRVDYAYDELGRIISIRDALANEAIGAGVRAPDSTTLTQLTYDGMSRTQTVTAPAPFGAVVPEGQSNTRSEHVFAYGAGTSRRHITGMPEPAGYLQHIEYDNLFRTTKLCDSTGQCASSEWHAEKDLLLATAGPTGLKSTTIYDQNDLPIESYGAAPAAWFGADRRPLAAYSSQVPRVDSRYDEGINGLSVAWYNAKGSNLVGAPKLYSTGINESEQDFIRRDFRISQPITPDNGMDGYGFRATGKITFPASGTYTFQSWFDDGARLFIDGKQIWAADTWAYRTNGVAQNSPSGTFAATAGKSYDIVLEYIHINDASGHGAIDLWMKGPGITNTNPTLGISRYGSLIKPGYNLTTSTTVYDSQLGNTSTTVNYGSRPEFGLAQSVTADTSGLGLTSTSAYETPGIAGSYLRRTSSSLPGGNTTAYAYYGATEAVDNPCTIENDPVSQAGFGKLTTEQDPDGTAGVSARTKEVVYDAKGRPVASRINDDPWTCTAYDEKGRVTQVIQPDINGRPGRTITSTYNLGGNPFHSVVTDSVAGSGEQVIDLLGRTIWSKDVWGHEYLTIYDSVGRVSTVSSPVGTESYTYDVYGRTTAYRLNTTTLYTITYDQHSRIASIDYPEAKDGITNTTLQLSNFVRDSLQRTIGSTMRLGTGENYVETVSLSPQMGKVTGATQTLGVESISQDYSYDGIGRMTSATIGDIRYDYGYGASDASCAPLAGYNANAHKNSNRTSQTVTELGTSTVLSQNTHCYDLADRLISSSDAEVGVPTYDDHGNTATLAGNGEEISFSYDASDYNIAIEQGDNKVEYLKTASGSVLRKKEYVNDVLTKSYRYVAGGRILQECDVNNNNSCGTVDTYIGLPGGVTMTLSPGHEDENLQTRYSLTNFHGDTVLVLNRQAHAISGLMAYGPFGETSPNTDTASNATDAVMGWAANPSRKQQQGFSLPIIQMGARVYIPTLGRFLQVDPVEGGTLNPYVYAHDPVNLDDYSGEFIPAIVGAILLAVSVASASKHLQDNPSSKGAWIGMALSVTGVGGALRVVASARTATVAVRPSAPKASQVKITQPYARPSNATTPAQRLFVQNQTCVTCGNLAPKMYADHKTPLVIEYYKKGSINLQNMRSVNAIQPQCPLCSNIQGGQLSNYSKYMKDFYGL